MLKELRNFFQEEDGGADQLIIAAILVMGGISVAILFGKEIRATVTGYIESFKSSEDIQGELNAE